MSEYLLSEIAQLTQSKLLGNPNQKISGIETLENAGQDQIAFLENPRYERQMAGSHAGAIIVHPSTHLSENKNYLLHEHPTLCFQQLIELFIQLPASGFLAIHPTAVIHENCVLKEEVTVAPRAVIDQGVVIGSRTQIGAGVIIGAGVTIGDDCFIHSNAVIREGCQIGNRVVVQPGAVIGSCGFGYFTDKKGVHHPLKQLGNVILEDDVEIGANTTIDRARFKTTRIGRGTKIDNLVQIGHQVELGPNNLIISQTGIAGSTKTGQSVIMGGQTGVIGHLTIADGTMLAARSAVSKNITQGGIYSGTPAIPIKQYNSQLVYLRNIEKFLRRLEALEKKLSSVQE